MIVSEKISFIGLGSMGQPMALNLLKAGYDLHVYNRDASKTEALTSKGAKRSESPANVVEPGGIVITMVANDAALEHVTLGEEGILQRLGPGGVHISMSTVSPAIARKLASIHAQRGCTYVAAPVFGRPEAAAAQKLWIAVAGDAAAKERVKPVLQALGQGIFDFGDDPGKANIVKICGNFTIVAAMETMAETLALAEKNGIDRSDYINMLSQTIFACPIYQNYGRMIAERQFTPVGFQLQLGLKDVNLVLDAAEDVHVPMPFASFAHDRFTTAVAKGWGEKDWAQVTQLVSEDAGL